MKYMLNNIKALLMQRWKQNNIIIIITSLYFSLLLPMYCISSVLCIAEQYKAAASSEDITSFTFSSSYLSKREQQLLTSKPNISVGFQFWIDEIVPEVTIDRSITILGYGGNYLDFNSFSVTEGTLLTESFSSDKNMECIISDELSNSERLYIGDSIVLRGYSLKIIGIVKGYGTEEIMIPYQLLEPIYKNHMLQQTVTISANESSEDSRMTFSILKQILPSSTDIVTSNFRDTQKDNLHLIYNMLLSRIFVSIVVSTFSLLNIYVLMLGLMYRKKKEYAILRAIGATHSEIFILFLKENITNMTIAEMLLLLSFQRLSVLIDMDQEISWNLYSTLGITIVAFIFSVVLSMLLSREVLKHSIYELLQGEDQ